MNSKTVLELGVHLEKNLKLVARNWMIYQLNYKPWQSSLVFLWLSILLVEECQHCFHVAPQLLAWHSERWMKYISWTVNKSCSVLLARQIKHSLCENKRTIFKWTFFFKNLPHSKDLPLVIQKACDTNVQEHMPFELAFWDQ